MVYGLTILQFLALSNVSLITKDGNEYQFWYSNIRVDIRIIFEYSSCKKYDHCVKGIC